jgi:hypothetical protein
MFFVAATQLLNNLTQHEQGFVDAPSFFQPTTIKKQS